MGLRICIVNAHWSNHGDEAALMPIIHALLKKYYPCQIEIIFKDKEEVKGFPAIDGVSYYSSHFLIETVGKMRSLINSKQSFESIENKVKLSIKNADLVIYSPGGAVISDRFWWKKQLEYLYPLFCAKQYKKPVIFAAPSIGPFDNNYQKNQIRKEILDYCETICIREQLSVNYLEGIKVSKNVKKTIDTAFYDDFDYFHENSMLNRNDELRNYLFKHKVIGITLSDFKWHVQLNRDPARIRALEAAVKSFIALVIGKGYKILFIPQLFGNQNDKDYLSSFETNNCMVLDESFNTYFQQFVISKCFAVIGMRYHSNIFAAKTGTPFLAIGYEEKMVGFMREYGLEEELIKIEDFTYDLICDKWNFLLKSYDRIKDALIAKREQWRSKAQITVHAITDYIDTHC